MKARAGHRKLFFLALITCIALLFLFSVSPLHANLAAQAHASLGYVLNWWTVDGGGVSNQESGSYSLSGTAGQPEAATWSGGNYTLTGGFWSGVGEAFESLYLPVLLKGQ